MDRKNIPLILMLAAGAITCIITYVMKFSVLSKLVSLFVVLLIFFCLGSALKWALDSFERQNQPVEEPQEESAENETEESTEQDSSAQE